MVRVDAVVPMEIRLAQALSQAERRVAGRVERVVEAASIGLEQWHVLSLLADGAGHRMSDIARFAMVPAPTLTKIVDRLVERNLVYRRVDTSDRRRVLVFLASRGRDLHRRLSVEVRRAEQEVVEQLGESDAAQLQQLVRLLLDRVT